MGKDNVKKIVVIGPESTGKSTLCSELARHYGTLWVPEFAREYLLKHGKQYTVESLWQIACGQLQAEDAMAAQLAPSQPGAALIIDTDMYVMKVWSEVVFDVCDNRILTHIANRPYHLYLLCNTDLPWEQDELREYPDLKQRQHLYQYYLDAMLNQPVPWVSISGAPRERLAKAIAAIDALLKQ